jgi:hypothetical protein
MNEQQDVNKNTSGRINEHTPAWGFVFSGCVKYHVNVKVTKSYFHKQREEKQKE